MTIEVPVTGVVADVFVRYKLSDVAIRRANQVVRAGKAAGILERLDRVRIGLFGVVDDDVLDLNAIGRTIRRIEVSSICGDEVANQPRGTLDGGGLGRRG